MLGVGLREHHQFHVVRVTPKVREGPSEIIDLVLREREAERAVGLHERGASLRAQRDRGEGARLLAPEEGGAGFDVGEHRLRHSVVQARADSVGHPGRRRAVEL